MSRTNYNIARQRERVPNEKTTTMTNTKLEISHQEITEGIVARVNQTTTTETEEDTPLFRRRLQKVLEIKFIAAATKKSQNLRQLINSVKKKGLGRDQILIRPVLVQCPQPVASAGGMLADRQTYRHPNTAASDKTGKPPSDTSRVGHHAGLMSKRAVPTHPSIKFPDGTKLQALYRAR